MKKTLLCAACTALLTLAPLAAAFGRQAVETTLYSNYLSFDGMPLVTQGTVYLYDDGDSVRIELPGASLSASDGSWYNGFLSFSFSMSEEDWTAILQ